MSDPDELDGPTTWESVEPRRRWQVVHDDELNAALGQAITTRLQSGALVPIMFGSFRRAPVDVRAWLTEQTGGHPGAFAIFRLQEPKP